MLVVSGHEYYLKRKNKTTTNWNCSKYQTHKCRATAITDGENFIETRGQHNHDISTGKLDARLVLKNIKELSDRNTPTVAVATALQPITDNIATQLALPSKEKTLPSKNLISMTPRVGTNLQRRKNTGCSTKKCRILCMSTKKKLICISSALWRT